MAYAESQQAARDVILGNSEPGDVALSSSGGSGGSSSGFGAPAPTGGAQPTGQSPGSSYGESLGFSREGGIQDRLVNPLSSTVDSGGQRLSDLSTSFYEQAGPSRSYEGIGGQSILDGAIDRGQQMDQARGLLNATYGGPQNLGWDAPWTAGDMQARSGALTSGGGLQSLIRGSTSLNPGEARYEAQRLLGDQDYLSRAQGAQSQSSDFLGRLDSERGQARDFATQRAGEEQGIRTQANAYAGQRQAGVQSGIQGRVDERNAGQAQSRANYDAFRAAANEETAQGAGILDAWNQRNEITAPRQAAEAERLRLEDLYSDISHIPLMDLGITGRGQEHQTFDIGYGPAAYEPAQRGLLEGLWAEPLGSAEDLDRQWTAEGKTGWHDLIDRIGERQADYSAAFSPETHAVHEQGQHALFNPLYLGEAFSGSELPELRNFTQFDAGTQANAENTATGDERGQLMRLADLLNQAPAIGEEQEFREAGTTADVDAFTQAWQDALVGRQRSLDAASQDWQGQVNAGYEAYRDRKESEQLGSILGLASLANPGLAGTLSAVRTQ